MKFFFRAFLAYCIFMIFMIATQDFHVLPSLAEGLFQSKNKLRTNLPRNIQSKFLETKKGNSIETWLYEVEGEKIVVIFRGNGESLESMYDIQRWLGELGYSSLSFDYSGTGRSTGWPSEEGLYEDAATAIKSVSDRFKTWVYLGVSLGTGIATHSSKFLIPDKIILLAPYYSLEQLVNENLMFRIITPLFKYKIPSANFLMEKTPDKVLIIHGTQDSVIPISHFRLFKKTFGSDPRFHFIEKTHSGHNDIISSSLADIRDFL